MAKKKGKKKVKGYSTNEVLEKVLVYLIGNKDIWISKNKIVQHFIKKKMLREQIYYAINKLEKQGKILKNKSGALQFNQSTLTKGQPIVGIVDMNKGGDAYVIAEGHTTDIFVKSGNINRALDGDTVEIELFLARKRSKRQEGKVVKVIKRHQTEFVGVLNVTKSYAFVIPDNNNIQVDFFIPPSKTKNANNKDKVIVKLLEWEARKKSPTAEVVEILGKPGLNDVEMKSILVAQGFSLNFPKAVLRETEKLNTTINNEEIKKRRDFREVTTFTIDPKDAKDFDDALSVKYLDNGNYEVGIHIADVSHYVQPGTALDEEARKRATSVYLVDRVLPMLPEKISNELCSLRPNETKLCYAAVFELDATGKVCKKWFGRTVIYSDRRFTYEEAQSVIETGEGDYAKEMLLLNSLAEKLRAKRFKHGSISFETEEVKFNFDKAGKPISIYVKQRKASNLLVEDFMLLANRLVATSIFEKEKKIKKNIPFPYRIHDVPDMEKLITFNHYAATFDLELDLTSTKTVAHSMNKIMKTVNGTPAQHLLSYMAVRSMSKAKYTISNIGHYGLAFDYYTHFTSPIRRYPDVLVHRMLTRVLNKDYNANGDSLEKTLMHCSAQEIKAVKAERAATKYKQVEFMLDKVGKTFEGMISGVKHYGLFVEIMENKCEGLIPIETLPFDKYIYKEAKQCIVGMLNDTVFKIGDIIQIKVTKADMEKQNIDMELVAISAPVVDGAIA